MKNENLPVLAIITPCYNEEEIISDSISKLSKILNNLISANIISKNSYISVVDDGSVDSTFDKLSDLSKENNKLKIIKLACNFGHQKAMLCGLISNNADIYITLDSDLQDDINVIPEMIEKYKNKNVDIVYTIRNNRNNDSFCKSFFADMYYVFAKFMGVKGIKNSADFRLVSDKVVSVLKNITENNLYLRGLIYSFGFKYDVVHFKRAKRLSGETKYTLPKQFDLAINGITSCSSFPVKLILIFSIVCFVMCFIKHSEIFFVGGLILFSLYIIGEYISKTYTESKNRPPFVISDKINYN